MQLNKSRRDSIRAHNKHVMSLDGTSVIKFAWLPVYLDNGVLIWLERYKVTYKASDLHLLQLRRTLVKSKISL